MKAPHPPRVDTYPHVASRSDDGPPVPVLIHQPQGAGPPGWVVWAHGGSWQRGSAHDWRYMTARLAQTSGWGVVSVDYRLAPVHRHPAALVDILTALAWTRHQHNGQPIAVGGDSAGGTIAACAALVARDRRQHLAAQLLAYPPLDPACRAPSYHRTGSIFPSPDAMRTAWHVWRGHCPESAIAADGTPLPSTPMEATTLRGLCPAVLAVGGHDPVRDDVRDYAAHLRRAGVPTSLQITPDAGHGDILQPGSILLRTLADSLSTFDLTH